MVRHTIALLMLLSIVPALATRRSSFDPNPQFALSTYAAGATATHRLSITVNPGDPELYLATLAYGSGFESRGFAAQGPAGSPVGAYELDFNFDDVPDRTLPVLSLTSSSAYVDVIADGRFSPDLEPAVDVSGDATLGLRLPFGGDATADTRVSTFGVRVTLQVNPNIIVNPKLGGRYEVAARLTSVDPDTDGADDGAGAAPETVRTVVAVQINGRVLAPFAKLRLGDLDVKTHGSNRDRLVVSGQFALGPASDGIDVERDAVAVSFASFAQTIPAAAFTGRKQTREYAGTGPGVHRFKLLSDGRFDLDVRDLHLIMPGPRQVFTLAVGNDFGEVTVVVPSKPDRKDKDRVSDR